MVPTAVTHQMELMGIWAAGVVMVEMVAHWLFRVLHTRTMELLQRQMDPVDRQERQAVERATPDLHGLGDTPITVLCRPNAAAQIAAGVSFKALARRLGVSDRCLRDRLRAAEMHRPPRRGALGEVQGRALPLLREGRSVRQVAGELGVSQATVTRWRDEAGITPRPVGVNERNHER